MSQLNKIQKEQDKEFRQRLNKITPIAIEALRIMTDGELLIGENMDKSGNLSDEFRKFYQDRSTKVLTLLRDSNIKYSDVDLVISFMVQPIDVLKEMIKNSLNTSAELAQNKLWGKEYLDVTLQDMDNVLKEKE